MSRFIENAAKLLDAAECGLRSGHTPSDLTVVIGAGGGIRIIAASDWPLDSLQAHHGAAMVYRITQENDAVRVEGRAGLNKCVLESPKPAKVARLLLSGGMNYEVVQPALNAIRKTEPCPAALSA